MDYSIAPLTSFGITFDDRQILKVLEDAVLNLKVILSSTLQYVKAIHEHCEKCCKKMCSQVKAYCTCEDLNEEFEQIIQEVEFYIDRADYLQRSAKSTAQLVSCKITRC